MADVNADRIEKAVTDLRISQAEGFAEIRARLENSKDHEPRLRELERRAESSLTLNDVKDVVAEAIEAARRPSWRDVGALVAAISTSTGLVLGLAKAFAFL